MSSSAKEAKTAGIVNTRNPVAASGSKQAPAKQPIKTHRFWRAHCLTLGHFSVLLPHFLAAAWRTVQWSHMIRDPMTQCSTVYILHVIFTGVEMPATHKYKKRMPHWRVTVIYCYLLQMTNDELLPCLSRYIAAVRASLLLSMRNESHHASACLNPKPCTRCLETIFGQPGRNSRATCPSHGRPPAARVFRGFAFRHRDLRQTTSLA